MLRLKKRTALAFALVTALGIGLLGTGPSFAQATKTGPSGLPIPRFVSLKSDRVNVRIGPSRDYKIGWTFVHAGLPVEIVQEYDNWRKVRDWEGKEGWVFHTLLSGRRTALLTPWEDDAKTPLRAKADSDAGILAELETRVLVTISECSEGWCAASIDEYEGYIDQTRLFGVYPDESFE